MSEPSYDSSFSLDDVTAKIAYAYAKQQVFAFFGLFSLVFVLGEVLGGSTTPPELALGGLTALVGAAVLALVFTQRDLKRVNRTSLLLAIAALLLSVVEAALVLLRILPAESAATLGGVAVVAFVSGGLVVSYPLPFKRGGTVLYKPAEIVELANARTLGFGAIFLLLVAVAGLLVRAPASTGAFLDPLYLEIIVAALGAEGFVMFILGKKNVGIIRHLRAVMLLALVVAAVLAADVARSTAALSYGLPPLLGAALLLAIVVVLSPRLNHGKTIVSHRA